MDTLDHFFKTASESIASNNFVKLTLSKPIRKAEGFLNVYVRLVTIDDKEVLRFKYRYTETNEIKIFTFTEAFAEITKLLDEKFRFGTIFSLDQDTIVTVSKKKKLNYRETAPSFKNKLPEDTDSVEA
ncbi:MAG: hypothetical protein COB98_07630 [Flavobacteriaceae bacterium]|nr:MAG: hypothetical protein COB98_07630 [Flavobacteriaceae bacterium]